MAKGFPIPAVFTNGRLKMDQDADQNAKLIRIAVMSGDSTNAFNDAGSQMPLFTKTSAAIRGLTERSIRHHLARLEKAGRIRSISVRTRENPDAPGEVEVNVEYVDLSTGQETKLRQKVQAVNP